MGSTIELFLNAFFTKLKFLNLGDQGIIFFIIKSKNFLFFKKKR